MICSGLSALWEGVCDSRKQTTYGNHHGVTEASVIHSQVIGMESLELRFAMVSC